LLFGVTVINSKKAQGLLQDAMTAQGQLVQFRPASTATIDLPATKNPRVRFDAVTMAQTELDMLDAHMDFRMDTFEVSRLRDSCFQPRGLVPLYSCCSLASTSPGSAALGSNSDSLMQATPATKVRLYAALLGCHGAFEDRVEQHLKSGSLCPSATGRATPTEK